MENAGIDVKKYGAHSTRAASTSAAKASNTSMKTIMDAAGWKNAETLRTLYDVPIGVSDSDNVSDELLKKSNV